LDLQLYLRVLWRFRVLLAIGLVLAICLAALAYVRVDVRNGSLKLSYRETERWQSESRLFVTQKGFPWGRTTPQYVRTSGSNPPVPAADATRLGNLAVLYAELAQGDRVQSLMGIHGDMKRRVEIKTLAGPAFSSVALLPIIQITAQGTSPGAAVTLARRATKGLLTFIHQQQAAARIAHNQRVEVEVLARAEDADVINGRGKTLPLVAFVAVMVAVIGLTFVLENLRPRSYAMGKVRPVPTAAPSAAAERANTAADAGRRTA
jgi:hypothetical protein